MLEKRLREEDALRAREDALTKELRKAKKREADLFKQKFKAEKEADAALKEKREAEKARLKQKQKEEHLHDKAKEKGAREDEHRALERALRDHQKELDLLNSQLQQKEELYKSGVSTADPVQQAKVEVEKKQLRMQALQRELSDLKAGRKLSPKEQQRRQLQSQAEALRIEMELSQQQYDIAKEKYKAGLLPQSELLVALQRFTACRAKLTDIEVQMKR